MISKGFQRARKYDARLRLALIGPSGAGKTMTALILATRIAAATGGRVAVLDTERGSASKYADQYDFDVLELDSYHPEAYAAAIQLAEEAGYPVLVIDSLSHAWAGKDGALELVDRFARKSNPQNSFAAWREVTPIHNRMVDAITGARLHVIATMRSKMEYVQTTDERGRTVIRKLGLQPIQRDGLEYEFDVVGDMTLENTLTVSKSRCPDLNGRVFERPDGQLAELLLKWLGGLEPPPLSPQLALRKELERLTTLREALGIERSELAAQAREMGINNRSNLTLEQINLLRSWLIDTARTVAEMSEGSEVELTLEADAVEDYCLPA